MKQGQLYRGILFDMDGVIIDSLTEVERFWQPRFREKDIEFSEREFLKQVHGRPAREVIEEFYADESVEQRKALLEECEEFDKNHAIRLMAGVQELLEELRNHGIPTGLVTSALPSKVRKTFQALGTDGYFSSIITSEDVNEGKPHPECYQKAAEGLGLRAQDCIVFEDSVNGIRAGHAAGALVVGINKPAFEDLLKQQGAHMVMPDFSSARLQKSENGLLEFSPNSNMATVVIAKD